MLSSSLARTHLFSARELAALLVLSILIPGCAHYKARPLDSGQSASSVIDQREAEGLYFAVKDISQSVNSARYFDRDLVEAGYVPVLVLAELDRDSNAVFDLRREDLQLCLQDGTRLLTADPARVSEDVAFSHVRSTLGFLLILPGFFLASSVSHANEELENDYRSKALESLRINPNARSFQGVVFFSLPEERRATFSMEEAFVEARLYMGGAADSVGKALEFPVHFGD
jgi:hypothetical protein